MPNYKRPHFYQPDSFNLSYGQIQLLTTRKTWDFQFDNILIDWIKGEAGRFNFSVSPAFGLGSRRAGGRAGSNLAQLHSTLMVEEY